MKKIVLPVIAGLLFTLASAACLQAGPAADGKKGNITVMVDGFQNDRGFARIGLCRSAESFKNSEEKAEISATARIAGGKAQYVFEGVPFGTYAVSVYQDENGNGKLDKGLFGKPLELYGFSNNAREIFQRPAFEKAAIVLDRTSLVVRVTVQ
jgi:uncharacterized protein (DUF2141 family)